MLKKGCQLPLVVILVAAGACCGWASVGLDDVLSCLETNGILVDRQQAVRGGIEGILKSIDPGATLVAGASLAVPAVSGTGTVSVAVEIWPEDIAYLKISALGCGSGREIMDHLRLLGDKAGVILDLRAAGGDDLETVSQLGSLGRSAGEPLFILTDNQDRPVSTNSVAEGLSFKPPLMVLTDDRTRLAAEAVVSLWRGRHGVMLIGAGTAGESRFREVLTLPGGQLITLATRKFLPLNSSGYEGLGIAPDVEVPRGDDNGLAVLSSTNAPARPLSVKSEQDRELMQRVGGDAALRRSTDILLGLRTLSGYGQR